MSYLFLFVWNERKIYLLFVSNFFQSFESGGKFIFHSYWFMMGRIFGIFFRSFLVSSRFSATAITFWKKLHYYILEFSLLFFAVDPFTTIYVWSTTAESHLIVYKMDSWNIIKNKVSALYRLFDAYLLRMQKWIKKFLDDFACITNRNYAVLTLAIHHKFLTTISWWNIFRSHCCMSFLFIRFFKIIYHTM